MKVIETTFNHKGVDKRCAAKVITVATMNEANEKLQEAMELSACRNIPRVVELYDAKINMNRTGSGIEVVLYTEF